MLRRYGTVMANDFLKSWGGRQGSIVVFAGVFDPVHNGHLSAARKALYYGSRVVFLPERVPQHKHGATPYQHRLNMLRIAVKDEPSLEVVDYPANNHWVVETFTWLTEKFPNNSFVWLIGQDVEGGIASWKDIDKLHDIGVKKIVVMGRDHDFSVYLEELHGVDVVHTHRPLRQDYELNSTRIRKDIHHYAEDVPKAVYEYIKENGLYSADSALK